MHEEEHHSTCTLCVHEGEHHTTRVHCACMRESTIVHVYCESMCEEDTTMRERNERDNDPSKLISSPTHLVDLLYSLLLSLLLLHSQLVTCHWTAGGVAKCMARGVVKGMAHSQRVLEDCKTSSTPLISQSWEILATLRIMEEPVTL